MLIMEKRAGFVDRKVQIFKEEQESWKDEHDTALACFELEQLIKDGIRLYEDICRLDEEWHLHVYGNPDSFVQSFSDRLRDLFSKWFGVTSGLLKIFQTAHANYAARGFDMDSFSKLCGSYKQCEAIFNPAVRTVECAELATVALELHRAGETEEMDEVCSN